MDPNYIRGIIFKFKGVCACVLIGQEVIGQHIGGERQGKHSIKSQTTSMVKWGQAHSCWELYELVLVKHLVNLNFYF